MRIYVMQHGEAVPKEADAQRPLSGRGRREVSALAALLDQLGVRVARVFHSGKTRAQQSAEIAAQALTAHGQAAETAHLGPNDPLDALLGEIDDWQEDTLLVGHMPHVSRLVSALVTGDEQQALVGYRPGAVVCVEREEDGQWLIAWALRPDLG